MSDMRISYQAAPNDPETILMFDADSGENIGYEDAPKPGAPQQASELVVRLEPVAVETRIPFRALVAASAIGGIFGGLVVAVLT